MPLQAHQALPYALFFLTGMAPWMLVNALFLQLAAFTDGHGGFAVPEGNAIASYMALAIQFGNIVTIGYVCLGKYIKFDLRKVILSILILEILTTLWLSFAWKAQMRVLGAHISVTLILVAFTSGVVGSMSNVTFWPFAVFYSPSMTAAMALGTSFSNILPSILAAMQLPGPSPRFSTSLFFVLTAGMLVIATLSFGLIGWTDLASPVKEAKEDSLTTPLLPRRKASLSRASSATRRRSANNNYSPCPPPQNANSNKNNTVSSGGVSLPSAGMRCSRNKEKIKGRYQESSGGGKEGKERGPPKALRVKVESVGSNGTGAKAVNNANVSPYSLPVFLQLWSCIMYFYIPGIQTFLVQSFAEKGKVLLWFTVVDKCVGVFGRFAASRSSLYLSAEMCCSLQTVAFGFMFITGWPFNLSSVGLIISCGFHSVLYSYTNTLVYMNNVRTQKNKSRAKAMSEWLGIAQQVGASTGIAVAFLQTVSGFFR
ncbi:hypothetical protein AAMO2058_000089100 [Amorphochlora amoebiformis]|mmetsp:Transcript_16581/g.26270  ORF Transcript_16581/g.26270 Transcript_16581/m.26270 type:complete len:484 (-) Transcript_16581:339-1790(-)